MEDADEIENEAEPEPEPEPEPEEDDNDEEPEEEDEQEADEQDQEQERGGGAGGGHGSNGAPTQDDQGGGGDPSSSTTEAKEKAASSGDVTTRVDVPQTTTTPSPSRQRTSATPAPEAAAAAALPPPPPLRTRPVVRPEALTAKLYDIVPTMAAPQATSINAIAITPDLRFWMTGGSDCYIRKYDGAGTINGKQLLTVAQRHPFVDSVVKAGILMSYWENEEPPPPASSSTSRGAEEHILSPVYSLAVHSQALWLLAGTEGGGINLQSVRHDEGKRITCLQRHSNAVSVLQLAPDEKSVLSGSWDRNIFDWDLNNGQIKRQFDGSGGQISAIELRPAAGAPIPQDGAYDEPSRSDTFSGNNAHPIPNGVLVNGVNGHAGPTGAANGDDGLADARGSPAHESLFGSPGESLFGGDNDGAGGGGGNPFGDDNDNEFSMALGDGAAQDDLAMSGVEMTGPSAAAPAAAAAPDSDATQPPPQPPASGDAAAGLINGDGGGGGAGDGSVAPAHESDAPPAVPPLSSSGLEADDSAAPPTTQTQPPAPAPDSPSMLFESQPGPSHFDPTQSSDTTFFSAGHDGTIRIWDRRVAMPVARIGNRPGVPPWCMGASWSPDGNWIYAGRRNGTVEEFNIHKARSGWAPERTLKFPTGSGPVSAVRAMVNGRHLVW